MNRVPFRIRSLEVAVAIEIPPPPSAAEVMRSSTALWPPAASFSSRLTRLRMRGAFERWKARQAGVCDA